MEKKIVIALVAIVLMFTVSAQAGTIGPSVSASATVAGQCKTDTVGTLAFGTITPGTTTGLITGTPADALIRCANGLDFTVALGSGGVTLSDGAGHTIPYTFTLSTVAGTGNGFKAATPKSSIAFTGSIAQTDYEDAFTDSVAGVSYNDTVTLTVTF